MLATVSHLVEHFEQELQQASPDYFYQQIHTYLEIEDEIEDTELKIHIFNNLEKAANLGHSEAAYYLFCCYHSNYKEILTEDSEKALYWLKKSAIQGYVTSQYYLGCYYNSGGNFYDPYEVFWFKGIKEKEGLYWMKKAAEQGHEDAINYLNNQSEND
jgi:TPR repeat protein